MAAPKGSTPIAYARPLSAELGLLQACQLGSEILAWTGSLQHSLCLRLSPVYQNTDGPAGTERSLHSQCKDGTAHSSAECLSQIDPDLRAGDRLCCCQHRERLSWQARLAYEGNRGQLRGHLWRQHRAQLGEGLPQPLCLPAGERGRGGSARYQSRCHHLHQLMALACSSSAACTSLHVTLCNLYSTGQCVS